MNRKKLSIIIAIVARFGTKHTSRSPNIGSPHIHRQYKVMCQNRIQYCETTYAKIRFSTITTIPRNTMQTRDAILCSKID